MSNMISRFIKNSLLHYVILLVVFSMFFTTNVIFAQFSESGDISIGLLPANPQPDQLVQVTIESYSINLDAAKITWYVNEKEVTRGTGIKSISTRTGKLGAETSVRVAVSTDTEVFTRSITITPASVNILWEARTYTPPLFKGKALFSHQSSILFVAIPRILVNGKEIPKENLVYTWSKNGTVLGDQNGYGRYTLPITGSIVSRPLSIEVEVNDPNTGITAFNTVDVTPVEPEILTYIVDPLYGINYSKAIKNILPLTGKEITLTAAPYFFSNAEGLSSNISYDWSINGDSISDGQNTRTRVFRKTGEMFGISTIGLKVVQKNRLLQFASYGLAIDFLKNE